MTLYPALSASLPGESPVGGSPLARRGHRRSSTRGKARAQIFVVSGFFDFLRIALSAVTASRCSRGSCCFFTVDGDAVAVATHLVADSHRLLDEHVAPALGAQQPEVVDPEHLRAPLLAFLIQTGARCLERRGGTPGAWRGVPGVVERGVEVRLVAMVVWLILAPRRGTVNVWPANETSLFSP